MLKFEKHCQTQAFTSELQGQIINEKVQRLGEVGQGRESHAVSWEVVQLSQLNLCRQNWRQDECRYQCLPEIAVFRGLNWFSMSGNQGGRVEKDPESSRTSLDSCQQDIRVWIKELCTSVTSHLLNRKQVSGRTHVDSEENKRKFIDFGTHHRGKQ